MIKNAEILEQLERQKCQRKVPKDWYKKADALYETAMSLNPDSVKKGGTKHVEMLISVTQKLRTAKEQMGSAK